MVRLEFAPGHANPAQCLTKEYLETNGRGGYASSSLINCHTRKYHALLCAHVPELGSKFVLLSQLEIGLLAPDGSSVELSTMQYPLAYHPQGYKNFSGYEQDLYPTFCYESTPSKIRVRQSLQMVHLQNTTLIKLEIKGAQGYKLRATPLLAYREFHQLTRSNLDLNVRSHSSRNQQNETVYEYCPYANLPKLFLSFDREAEYYPAPHWHYNVEYAQERERGFDYQEDLFRPGIFEMALSDQETLYFYASTEYRNEPVATLWKNEEQRRVRLMDPHAKHNPTITTLQREGAKFIVNNPVTGHSIVAGYPWFGEWGRDTMIALPGLTFWSGRSEVGVEILKNYCRYLKNGLMPNYLPQAHHHEPAYNSIDSSLWFFWAVQEFIKSNKRQNQGLAMDLFLQPMKAIVDAYRNDQVPCAQLHKNGLLWAGDRQTQLTWMDAQVDGRPVTPRYGYAVEINALWYNALNFTLELGTSSFDPSYKQELQKLIQACRHSFNESFWIADKQHLADVVNEVRDQTLRPNQIFAVSLPYSPLDAKHQKEVVRSLKNSLLTPFGLRTLDPQDPHYCALYQGDGRSRDRAYHQGTVWPWLLGHFIDAYLKVAFDPAQAKTYLKQFLSPLTHQHLEEYGVGSIAEIFDGNPPFRPNGCIAQAWSVGEVIRGLQLLES